MHLAVLMTNTDESDFADRHPRDGEKFATMIASVRPDWQISVFAVKDGSFPRTLSGFDGIMITGSPASVHDPDPWISRLEKLVRDCVAARVPLFGACFGHQVIAKALGGTVEENPNGWVFGLAEAEATDRPDWARGIGDRFSQYAAHIEQVTSLPDGARAWARADHCDTVGFVIGNFVFTTQNHPEMSHAFMSALIEEYGPKLPPDVVDTARSSMEGRADTDTFAEAVARFFEQAIA